MKLSCRILLTACLAGIGATTSGAAAIAQPPPPAPPECLAGNCGLSSFGEPPAAPPPHPESR
ncbi:hypothetical protein SAMN05421805_10637 [Saccharopolyspora antimicrobica]|uniref:Uncharacterized protein n=1 Tax=Saccharopolyspora antimicrobica TaxID=455193 RepID=A0A1I5AX77_9PSEU|nr:hypothetical protein ATL45_4763 [Saccharopolyspora antimicrobica]SFN67054.1 hypothetical protein SAMN05421805_10637 [Saccharopolyspora antimicrobica]